MTILNGDKIEKLLWESGFDFQHRTGLDGFSSLEVWSGNMVVVVSETWQDADDWYLDTNTMMLEVKTDSGEQYDDYEPVDSELDLIARIEYYGE